jgi:hypothetical protein
MFAKKAEGAGVTEAVRVALGKGLTGLEQTVVEARTWFGK